jgi:hypothetical protein
MFFFASLWVGGATTLLLMTFFASPEDGSAVYGISYSKKFVDDLVIIPGAIGLLLTGVLYSLFTNWGWFKHRWITVKWIVNLFGVILGTFWLGPWTNSLVPLSRSEGARVLSNPVYVHNIAMLKAWGSLLLATILLALLVSVIKPWKKASRG